MAKKDKVSHRVRYREQRALEQGGRCFYCHLRMGDDVTLEHLKAQSLGGSHSYENLRAAHAKCNTLVGSLEVPEKMRLHWIGKTEGSDAFFREAAKYGSIRYRRKELQQDRSARKRQKNIVMAMLAVAEQRRLDELSRAAQGIAA